MEGILMGKSDVYGMVVLKTSSSAFGNTILYICLSAVSF
jgi:hypothetical protein